MAIRIEDVAGTDFSDVAGTERIGPVTPGDVLREEFMVPLGLSARALARELGVPSNRITAILAGDRGITAETAMLLGGRFGTSAEFWLNLQMMHELEEARQHMRGAGGASRSSGRTTPHIPSDASMSIRDVASLTQRSFPGSCDSVWPGGRSVVRRGRRVFGGRPTCSCSTVRR